MPLDSKYDRVQAETELEMERCQSLLPLLYKNQAGSNPVKIEIAARAARAILLHSTPDLLNGFYAVFDRSRGKNQFQKFIWYMARRAPFGMPAELEQQNYLDFAVIASGIEGIVSLYPHRPGVIPTAAVLIAWLTKKDLAGLHRFMKQERDRKQAEEDAKRFADRKAAWEKVQAEKEEQRKADEEATAKAECVEAETRGVTVEELRAEKVAQSLAEAQARAESLRITLLGRLFDRSEGNNRDGTYIQVVRNGETRSLSLEDEGQIIDCLLLD